MGRPKSANAHETRQRILDAARRLFATHGFERASNRAIADEADLTTGAIYHYFDRKLDIYVAVYADTQALVQERIGAAIAPCETMHDGLHAYLDTAHEMNNEDPSLAMFLHSSRIDAQRDPELQLALREVHSRDRSGFFGVLLDLGLRTGELAPADEEMFTTVLRTISAGLVDEVSADPARHRRAIDGVFRLLDGSLLSVPSTQRVG